MEESLKHILKLGFYPEVIIDVGAADGTLPLLNTFPESEYIWIEPLIEFEEALKKLTQKFKGRYIITGAGNFNGKMIINAHTDLYGSSFYEEEDGKETDGKPREVAVMRLDELMKNYNFASDDLLCKVDVQGAELDVLAGAQQLMTYCGVVILEVSFFRFLKGAPEFYEVIDYMKKRGFVVYDIFGGHNRPFDGALAQRDVLFVKEDSYSRNNHKWSK